MDTSLRKLISDMPAGHSLTISLPFPSIRTVRGYGSELGRGMGRKYTVNVDNLGGKFIDGQLKFPVTITRTA